MFYYGFCPWGGEGGGGGCGGGGGGGGGGGRLNEIKKHLKQAENRDTVNALFILK